MATIHSLDHARASSTTRSGRATCAGQATSSGHRSENQVITSSYLRAVNVLASSSSRSKKRQSPAASRPTVAMLTEREAAYAEAQAMRFERSSVSMASEDSRNFPTLQADFVGNFPLAHSREKSDKSAMTTAAQIRATIREALAGHGHGEISVVTAMKAENRTDVERNYLADFLKGKKQSLSYDFSTELADFLGLDVALLRVKRAASVPAIRKGTRPHLYITEHMDARGLDDAYMAGRIDGIDLQTFARWRSAPDKLAPWQVAAVLHAFDMEDAADLTRPPARVTTRPKTTERHAVTAGRRRA